MPALTPEQEMLKQAALAADQDGQHIYTSWRDSNNSDANDAWHKAASPAAILAILSQLEAVQPIPDALFDGNAVYEEITRKLGKGHCISAEAVSATLDAVVRLIRAAKAVPGEPGQ